MSAISQLNGYNSGLSPSEETAFPSQGLSTKVAEFMTSFMRRNGCSQNPKIIFDKSGTDATIQWTGKELTWFKNNYPVEFHKTWLTPADRFTVTFHQDKETDIEMHFSGHQRAASHGWEHASFCIQGILNGIDENGKLLMHMNRQ